MIQHIKILSLLSPNMLQTLFVYKSLFSSLKIERTGGGKSLLFCFVILSVQLFLLKFSEEKAALGTGLSSLQHPQKGFDAQVGGLKTLTGCHPGSWLRAAYLGPETANAAGKRGGKEQERNMKEEIVRGRDRKKGAMLVTYQFGAHSCGGAIC